MPADQKGKKSKRQITSDRHYLDKLHKEAAAAGEKLSCGIGHDSVKLLYSPEAYFYFFSRLTGSHAAALIACTMLGFVGFAAAESNSRSQSDSSDLGPHSHSSRSSSTVAAGQALVVEFDQSRSNQQQECFPEDKLKESELPSFADTLVVLTRTEQFSKVKAATADQIISLGLEFLRALQTDLNTVYGELSVANELREKAIILLENAKQEQGDTQARLHKLAFTLFKLAAELGHPVAEIDVAWCHRNGIYVQRDLSEAFKHYEKISQDLTSSMRSRALAFMANAYQNEEGVSRDFQQSHQLWKQANDLGDDWAKQVLDEQKPLWDSVSILAKLQDDSTLMTTLSSLEDEMLVQVQQQLSTKNVPLPIADILREKAVFILQQNKEPVEEQSQTEASLQDTTWLSSMVGSMTSYWQAVEDVIPNLSVSDAFVLLQRAEALGHPEAPSDIAWCYANSKGVERDLVAAFKKNQAIAENKAFSKTGRALALAKLARAYQEGEGTTVDLAKARELWQRAANLGNEWAQGVVKNKQVEWEHADSAKNVFDMINDPTTPISVLLSITDDKLVELQQTLATSEIPLPGADALRERAIPLLKKLADPSAVQLQQQRHAFRLLKRAAKLGHPKVPLDIAWCHQEGIGTDQDDVAAVVVYQATFDQENLPKETRALALAKVANAYSLGKGVDEKDWHKARDLFQQAAKMGAPWAQEMVTFHQPYWDLFDKITDADTTVEALISVDINELVALQGDMGTQEVAAILRDRVTAFVRQQPYSYQNSQSKKEAFLSAFLMEPKQLVPESLRLCGRAAILGDDVANFFVDQYSYKFYASHNDENKTFHESRAKLIRVLHDEEQPTFMREATAVTLVSEYYDKLREMVNEATLDELVVYDVQELLTMQACLQMFQKKSTVELLLQYEAILHPGDAHYLANMEQFFSKHSVFKSKWPVAAILSKQVNLLLQIMNIVADEERQAIFALVEELQKKVAILEGRDLEQETYVVAYSGTSIDDKQAIFPELMPVSYESLQKLASTSPIETQYGAVELFLSVASNRILHGEINANNQQYFFAGYCSIRKEVLTLELIDSEANTWQSYVNRYSSMCEQLARRFQLEYSDAFSKANNQSSFFSFDMVEEDWRTETNFENFVKFAEKNPHSFTAQLLTSFGCELPFQEEASVILIKEGKEEASSIRLTA